MTYPTINHISLSLAIPMVLYDKGPLTKDECFGIFKRIEITNAEFDKAWKHNISWGQVHMYGITKKEGVEVPTYRADSYLHSVRHYLPDLYDGIYGESPIKEYKVIVRCGERYKDMTLNEIRQAIAVKSAKFEE